jgi:ribosome biogenesis GTPase A
MNVTKKAIIERVKDIDVVIELLDARLPGSSANPMLAQLTNRKPKLKVLNKQDLADAERTAAWLAHYCAQSDTRAIGLDASETAPAQRLIKSCRELAPHRGGMAKPLRVMICGVPNVGKSTLMNTLAGKKAAKTGDEAGITKVEQRPECCGPRSLSSKAATTWQPVALWVAMPMMNKKLRLRC